MSVRMQTAAFHSEKNVGTNFYYCYEKTGTFEIYSRNYHMDSSIYTILDGRKYKKYQEY